MNLIARCSTPAAAGTGKFPGGHSGTQSGVPSGATPILLTLRPSRGVAGDFVYQTTSAALLRLLDHKTDLPASVLSRFRTEIETAPAARLLGVELSERVLTDLGYFVD